MEAMVWAVEAMAKAGAAMVRVGVVMATVVVVMVAMAKAGAALVGRVELQEGCESLGRTEMRCARFPKLPCPPCAFESCSKRLA